jgi:hypothetical protein
MVRREREGETDLEEFENVKPDVKVGEFRVEGFEIRVLYRSIRTASKTISHPILSYPIETEASLTLTYSETMDGVFDYPTSNPYQFDSRFPSQHANHLHLPEDPSQRPKAQ